MQVNIPVPRILRDMGISWCPAISREDVSSGECVWAIIDPKCLGSDTHGQGAETNKVSGILCLVVLCRKICQGDYSSLCCFEF